MSNFSKIGKKKKFKILYENLFPFFFFDFYDLEKSVEIWGNERIAACKGNISHVAPQAAYKPTK